jgi:hypothetical protein
VVLLPVPASSSRSRLERWYFLDFVCEFAFRLPSIIGALRPDPDRGSITEEFAETDGYGRGNRLPLLKDIVKVLTGNTKESSDLSLRLAGRGNYVLAQQFTRMSRAPVPIVLSSIFDRDSAPQWYCSRSTRSACPESNSKVMHHGPLP